MKLYQFWRSSASWRVRWALALKKVTYESAFVDLAAGAHHTALVPINPMHQVPALMLDDGRILTESVAIIEWLDETIPEPRLLPSDPFQRAQARELVQIINSGIHPLQNMITQLTLSPDLEVRRLWCCRFIERGLAAYEAHVARHDGPFSMGDQFTIADLFLVPQVRNAERYGADISTCPRLLAIYAHCMDTPEAQTTQPKPALQTA